MKFHNLYINTNSFETYQKVSDILKIIPKAETKDFSLWTYQVTEKEDDPFFDFTTHFLDLLEPNFENLKGIGIEKEDIIIWLFYEYNQQCALGFHPQEMKRLGESGIAFNIDCIRRDK